METIADFHSQMFCKTEVGKNTNKTEKNEDRDEIREICVKGFSLPQL